jgi:hypothetical protein
MGVTGQVIRTETLRCAICKEPFYVRRYENREICRACEKVAIEKDRLGKQRDR